METEDYHFKFRITLLGEKSVGKSTFLDVLANNFGKIVEQEVSDELNIKVQDLCRLRPWAIWMMTLCTK
jgi:nicotinamide riboside kinase